MCAVWCGVVCVCVCVCVRALSNNNSLVVVKSINTNLDRLPMTLVIICLFSTGTSYRQQFHTSCYIRAAFGE